MHRIGSVGSRSFITRMLATASLLALYVLGTGALTLAGAGSAAAEPNYYRNRGTREYSRGRGTIGGAPVSRMDGGIRIGPGGIIGIGTGGRFNAMPTGARSGEARSNNTPKVFSGSNRSKSAAIPKSNMRIRSAPLQGQNQSGREKIPSSTANSAPDRPTAFPPQHSSSSAPGSPPFKPGGMSRGAGEMQNPGSRGVSVPGPTGGAGNETATGGNSSQQESLGADRDAAPTPRNRASKRSTGTSRDSATPPRDGTDGSRDNTVAARDGAGGGALKAEDIRRAIDRCAQTYVSYDRVTMTYTDHQGDKQSCP